MSEITIPFPISEIIVSPEPTGRVRLSDDIQQTLASLMGYDGGSRRLLRCSQSGTLFVTSPPIKNIVLITAPSATYFWDGDNSEISEVMIHAFEDNVSNVLVFVDTKTIDDNYWVLTPGESVQFSINNLNRLHIYFVVQNDVANLAYTR